MRVALLVDRMRFGQALLAALLLLLAVPALAAGGGEEHESLFYPTLNLVMLLAVLYYFAMMHAAGFTDRIGLRRVADFLRRRIPRARIETGCGKLIGAEFQLVVTEVGGCAVDIDTAQEYEAARARFREWRQMQSERAAKLRAEFAGNLGDSGR